MKIGLTILLIILLHPVILHAQRFSRDYRDRPMTEVLSDLATAGGQRIVFIHDELEDFTVTQQFESLSIVDAIRACIGFYPISLSCQGDSILIVKCTQKARRRLIGHLTDEHDMPVSYANITLYSPIDSTIINKGVSNQNGRFVIPCDTAEFIMRVSHIAYKPLRRRCQPTNIGTLRLETALEPIDSLSIVASRTKQKEQTYRLLAQMVDVNVWNMGLPQFNIDTIPLKYRDAPAVVLAEYDSICHSEHHDPLLKISSKRWIGSRWLETTHLHRVRYMVNSAEGVRRLSHFAYSTQTDVTNFVMYKTTFVGIRIISPDGGIHTVNTLPYFTPRKLKPQQDGTGVDSISIAPLTTGDIVDLYVFHRYKEPLSPYVMHFPTDFPVLSYEARAVAGQHVSISFEEHHSPATAQLKGDGNQQILTYHLHDYWSKEARTPSFTLLKAQTSGSQQPSIKATATELSETK